MAGAIVQTKDAANAASGTALSVGAMGSNVTAGNYLWIIQSADNAGDGITPTKIAGTATIGTPVDHGSIVEPTTGNAVRHWTVEITGSGSLTIQVNWDVSAADRCALVVEVSGVNAVQGSDEQGGNNNSPTDTCTVNVTAQPAFGLMCLVNYQGAGSGVGTGWTLHSEGFSWTSVIGEGVLQYKAITSTGNTTGNFTNGGVDFYCSVMIVFTDGGGGPASTALSEAGFYPSEPQTNPAFIGTW